MVYGKSQNLFIYFAYAYSFVPVPFVEKIALSSLCALTRLSKKRLILLTDVSPLNVIKMKSNKFEGAYNKSHV